jgi:putative membrane protein insertion efficiency factor/ribonuclease P protein component
MLPSRYRLHSRSEISETIRHGRRARRGTVVVHVRVGDDDSTEARAAFAVNKAVGDSVTRHRVTRRLRGVLPPLLDRMPGGSALVVRAMPEAATATSDQLREDLERALARVTPLLPPTCPSTTVEALPPASDPETLGSGAGAPRTGIARVMHALGWPLRSLLLGLIWVYRHTISPMLPPTCRYHPSCSAYGFEALQVHGALKGTALTGWRVLRCNPFTRGGLDPVPPRGAWRPDIHPDGTPRVAAGPAA